MSILCIMCEAAQPRPDSNLCAACAEIAATRGADVGRSPPEIAMLGDDEATDATEYPNPFKAVANGLRTQAAEMRESREALTEVGAAELAGELLMCAVRLEHAAAKFDEFALTEEGGDDANADEA